MSNHDAILRLLLEQAVEVFPGSSFRFSTRFFAKDSTFQIAMTKDAGDRTGEVFFAQGDGVSTHAAALKLADAFVNVLDKRTTEFEKRLADETKSLGDHMVTMQRAAFAIKAATVSAEG